MKYFLTLVILVFAGMLYSQSWFEVAPDSRETSLKTLPEYQKKFEDHWAGKEIELGYYYEDGRKKKAYGWKQFRRFEYFWETRVNANGTFPSQRQYDIASRQFLTSKQRSEQGNWLNLGPSASKGGYAGVGRINQIVFHPNDPNTFWVTTPQGGLWTTENGGLGWRPLTEEIENLTCSGLAVPSDYDISQTIYLGTGEMDSWQYDNGIGILKSTDGGSTWQKTGLTFDVTESVSVNRILIHPNDNNFLYAATTRGIYISHDAAASWELIYDEDHVSDLEFDPSDPSVLYGSNKSWGRIYKLTDDGQNARTVYNEYLDGARRIEIAVAPSSPNIIYAIVADNEGGLKNILKSSDSGETYDVVFTSQANSEKPNLLTWNIEGADTGGQGHYDLALVVDPNDHNTVYVGGVNTWRSQDGGATWSIVSFWTGSGGTGVQTVHADKHHFKYNGDILYECNDGGLYKSQDGTSWDYISNGIRNSQIYKIGVSQSTEEDIIAGLQDNGTKSYYNGNWYDVIGGDGMDCMIDHQNPDIQYGELYYGYLRRTLNHWGNKKSIQPSEALGAWITPLAMNPVDPAIIYAGYQHIYKSKDRGDNWEIIFNLGSSSRFRHLTVAPSDTSVIYAGELKRIWKTTDAGENWTNITSGLPDVTITGIAVHKSNPSTIWVSLGGYNEHSVYQSDNGGESWRNISYGLPEIPVNTIVHNGQNNEILELYIGTDFGIYFRLGEGNWHLYSKNMPKVVITDLEIYYDETTPKNSKLRAATYGRGLWESDLYSVEAPPVADFSADRTEIFIGQTVNFTDETTHTPFIWEWTFEGGSPASSTKANPSVSYNEAGSFLVQLSVSNGSGLDTIIKTSFINVSCDERLNYVAEKARSIPGSFESIVSTGNTIEVENDDDANSLPVEIGFDFEYNCSSFSSFILNTNGFIKLGDTPPSGNALFFDEATGNLGGPLNSEDSLDRYIIAPFNHDLTGEGEGEFTVLTEGEAPNRVCTIQFSNLKDKTESPVSQYKKIDFQIKLFETSGIIEFVYGDWISSGNNTAYKAAGCGLKGKGTESDFVLLAGKSSDADWTEVYFQNELYDPGDFALNFGNPDKPQPDMGRTFRFVPKYFRDLHIKEIFALSQVPGEFGTPEEIHAIVHNDGLNNVHNLQVAFASAGSSSSQKTVSIDEVRSGEDKVISLGTFQPKEYGSHTLTLTLPIDEYPEDNTFSIEQETTINRYNYADDSAPNSSWGFASGEEGTLFSKFSMNGSAFMHSVDLFIFDDPENLGQQIKGAVYSYRSDTVYFSDVLTIESDHLGNWINIQMPDSTLLMNESFLAGIHCLPSISENAYYPLGVQTESPTRPETYYQSEGSIFDTIVQDGSFGLRYMIAATVQPLIWDEGIVSTNDTLICSGDKARVTVSVKPSGMEWQVSDNGLSSWYQPQGGFGLNNKTFLTDNLYQDQFFRIKVPVNDELYAHSNVVKVEVAPDFDISETITHCLGQSYVFPDGFVIDHVFEPVEHTSKLSSVYGCDSIIHTTLELLPAAYQITYDTICKFDDYVFADGNIVQAIEEDLLYEIAFPLSNGCDSIMATQLIVENVETSVSVTDTSLTANLENATYQWIDCENNHSPIDGETSRLFVPDRSGIFAVVIDDGNCTDSSECIHFQHVSTFEPGNNHLFLFPNPTTGNINVKSTEPMYELHLYDLEGKKVISKYLEGLRNYDFIIEDAQPGIFIIEINTATNVLIRKIIVE